MTFVILIVLAWWYSIENICRNLIIWTDHQSLVSSFKSQNLQLHSPIENNWIQEICQFTCDVCYLPGKSNQVSDFLSHPFDCPPPSEYVNIDDHIATSSVRKPFRRPKPTAKKLRVIGKVFTRAARFLGGFTSHQFLGSLGYVWVTLRRIWPRVVVFRVGESVL